MIAHEVGHHVQNLTGTSSDPDVLRILAPLVLQSEHVDHLAQALAAIAPTMD